MPDHKVAVLEAGEAVLQDGMRLPYDLFLRIPVHRVPDVVAASGMTENGWVPVEPTTLATRFPNVYAVGDVTSVGTPKAGLFAEGAARVVADQLIARIRTEGEPPGNDGTGSCYIEAGDNGVARVDVDFFSTPGHPTGTFRAPSPRNDRREGRVRLEPARPLVWGLTPGVAPPPRIVVLPGSP